MQEINKTPGLGVSELAERLSIHQSSASQLVDKLAEHGLITKERSKEDQRRVGLKVTEEGAKILVNAPDPAEGLLPEALQTLPESELIALDKSLIEVIGRFHTRDDKHAVKPLSDL